MVFKRLGRAVLAGIVLLAGAMVEQTPLWRRS